MAKKIFLFNCIAEKRQLLNMSQESLAKLSGTTLYTIQAIENNSYACSIKLAICISLVLQVPVDDLFWLDVKS